jgi:hypothetical protein
MMSSTSKAGLTFEHEGQAFLEKRPPRWRQSGATA